MTAYGKLNLAGMVALPLAAAVAAMIAFGDAADGRVLMWVSVLNAIPMLIGGAISGLLLRGANRAGAGRGIALWPTLIPAALGVIWYLWRAVLPEQVAPQREYIAAPQYLLMGVILLSVVAWIGVRIARARHASS